MNDKLMKISEMQNIWVLKSNFKTTIKSDLSNVFPGYTQKI